MHINGCCTNQGMMLPGLLSFVSNNNARFIWTINSSLLPCAKLHEESSGHVVPCSGKMTNYRLLQATTDLSMMEENGLIV